MIKKKDKNGSAWWMLAPFAGPIFAGILYVGSIINYKPIKIPDEEYFGIDRKDPTHIIAHANSLFSNTHYYDRNNDGSIDEIVQRSYIGVKFPVGVLVKKKYTREEAPELFEKADKEYQEVLKRK